MIVVQLLDLEAEPWTEEVGPSINPVAPDSYAIAQSSEALSLVMCSNKPYGGWLAKHVAPLVLPAPSIKFYYSLMIDDPTLIYGQVIETDTKVTDANGITYDLSAQFNLAKDWMFQVGNPWKDTGIMIEPLTPYQPKIIGIEYAIDYVKQVGSVVAVSCGGRYPVPQAMQNQPGEKIGWAINEIVTQLQQCNNSQPGGYTLRFSNCSYILQDPVA